MRVDTFSVRGTPAEDLLTEEMRAEARRTTVLQIPRPVILAGLRLAVRKPGAVARGMGRALRTGPASPKARLWQIFYLLQAMHLLRHLRHRGLDHVHVHFANNGADIARAAIALARDIAPERPWRWSFSMHGPTEFENVERHDLAAKVSDADGVACITDFARSQLMRLSPPAQWPTLDVVPMSVDVTRFVPLERTRAEGDALRVLFVGRLVPEKGPSVLVDAVARLRSAGVPLDVRIAGGGPLAGDLREDVARRDLGAHVELCGAVGQDRILDLYWWADVFCLPSFQEGLPVVLMEAMATGLPVVTTPIAGIPELVHDRVEGLLVPPGRPDLLGEALQTLAGDVSLRQRLAVRGREVVASRHSMAVAGARQAAFLNRVSAPGRGLGSQCGASPDLS